MDILIEGTYLARESAGYGPEDFSVNGERVVQAADLVRAASRRFYARGNAACTLSFVTNRQFDSSRWRLPPRCGSSIAPPGRWGPPTRPEPPTTGESPTSF